jgi:DNA-binding XRE family transcriptional regulator
MTSFARRQIAHTASDGTWTFLPGRPHQWTGDELVGVISRDDRRHAYLLHDGEQEAFYAWARTCGRGRRRLAGMTPPPADLRAARATAGHTQVQAAALVRASRRSWIDWEAGTTAMPAGLWLLYRLLIGQLTLDEARRG